MKIIQKSLFYRIEAAIKNEKLCHRQTYFFLTTSKECPLYDLDDTVYAYPYKNIGLGIFAVVMLVGVIIVLLDMLFHQNSWDNVLFYAVPSAVTGILFFLTRQTRIYIDSEIGIFEFLPTQEAADFLIAVQNARSQYTKYATDTIHTLSFDEHIAELKQQCIAQKVDKKALPAWVDSYAEMFLKCPCPLCNKRKGINGLAVGTVYGVIIAPVVYTEVVIGCEECMAAAVKKANTESLCFGLWSMPWGLFVPPLVILMNKKKLAHIQMAIPSKALKKHIIKLLKKSLKDSKIYM